MIHFTLIVIVVTQGAAAPVVLEQPIVQEQPLDKQPPEPGAINWHCPQCNWFNVYETMTLFKIGSKAHLRRCPNRSRDLKFEIGQH